MELLKNNTTVTSSKQISNQNWFNCCGSTGQSAIQFEYLIKKYQSRKNKEITPIDLQFFEQIPHTKQRLKRFKNNDSFAEKRSLAAKNKSQSLKMKINLSQNISNLQNELIPQPYLNIRHSEDVELTRPPRTGHINSIQKENISQTDEQRKRSKYSLKHKSQRYNGVNELQQLSRQIDLKLELKRSEKEVKLFHLPFRQTDANSSNSKPYVIQLGQGLPTLRSEFNQTHGQSTDRSYAI